MFEVGVEAPPFQAAVDRALGSPSGWLWLRRGAFGADTARWIVLDEKGELAGFFDLPTAVELHRVDSTHAWGVLKGDFDEPYVVRFRLGNLCTGT